MRHQADLEEDREDDDDLNETDAFGTALKGYAEEIKAELEETKAPNISVPDSVTQKRVAIATPSFASPKAAQISGAPEVPPTQEEESTNAESSGRDMDAEEQIWQKIIEKHGRDEYNLVYQITDKYRQDRFTPDNQTLITNEVKQKIGDKLGDYEIAEIIGLVSSRMILEDHAKKFS